MIDIPPPRPPAKGTVVLLHGWGANSLDVEPLAQSLRLSRIRYLIPEGRVEVPGTGGRGKGWFTFPVSDRSEHERQESMKQVSSILDSLSESGTPAEQTVLMGFSQGASLCLDVAFDYPKSVAGIISLSGFVIPQLQDRIRRVNTDSLPLHIPLFAGHGKLDPIVPMEMGKSSFDVLREKGFEVQWHEYDAGHHVVVEELEDIRAFLSGLFS